MRSREFKERMANLTKEKDLITISHGDFYFHLVAAYETPDIFIDPVIRLDTSPIIDR